MVDACEKEQTALLKEYVLKRKEELSCLADSEISAAGPLSISPFVPCARSRIPYILQAARIGPEDVLYDLGCGDGLVLHEAALRCGCRCVGLEIDQSCLEQAYKRAEELGISGLCRWGRCDLCSLPEGALTKGGALLEDRVVQVGPVPDGEDKSLPLPTVGLIFVTANGLVRLRPWLHGEWSSSPQGLRLVTCVESLDSAMDYTNPEGIFAEANEQQWNVCRDHAKWGVFVVPPQSTTVERWSEIGGPPLQLLRSEAEATEPLIVQDVLSQEDISLVERLALDHINAEKCQHGEGDEANINMFEFSSDADFHGAAEDALHSLPQHRVVHLHGVRAFDDESTGIPALERKMFEAMKANDHWGLLNRRQLNVRSFEFHSYSDGGSVLDPEHRDDGSLLTMSVLLSPLEDFQGGELVTIQSNQRVKHSVSRGDGLLFLSDKIHNVEEVKGRRHALIMEIWEGPRNTRNRWS